jgi:hypothetical protein
MPLPLNTYCEEEDNNTFLLFASLPLSISSLYLAGGVGYI